MRAQRLLAAQKVGRLLSIAEGSVDTTVAHFAELTAAMPVARLEAELAASVGHQALSRAVEATALLVQARGLMVEVHQHLQDTQKQIGLGEVSVGDGFGKPPITKPQAKQPALREVA